MTTSGDGVEHVFTRSPERNGFICYSTIFSAGSPYQISLSPVPPASPNDHGHHNRGSMHFPSGNDLLAAAFNSLIPPSPMPPAEGSLRDRLIALVLAHAEFVAEAPTVMTAMSWVALGRDLEGLPERRHTHAAESPAITTLRERIAQQYAAPFDALFDSPEAAELGEVDRSRAIALLIGPLVLGRLSALPDFDCRECARSRRRVPARSACAEQNDRSECGIGRCLRPQVR